MLDVELKLLLIEDDAEDKDIFEYMLSKIDGLKYQVKWCNSFSAGKEEILNSHYDVIFMDYRLGEGDGVSLLRYAKENDCRAPIIFLSAEKGREIYKEIKQWGALNYLKKGEITPDHLAIAIDYAIEIAAQYQLLREIASHDGLTGLYNHREMHVLFDKEIDRARRYKTSLSLIMLDIDYFKKINDSYGHLVGDCVIRWLAELIKESSRTCDINSRYGGEEFAIILPETTGESAYTKAEALRQLIENSAYSDEKINISITVSMGVAEFGASDTKMSFIDRADKALYSSKSLGRNHVCYEIA
ncbi:diguanylate cyclase [Pseudomonadota bacterium]